MIEEWRSIPGYEGSYEVSSIGNFRSLDRWIEYVNGARRFYKGQLLSLWVADANGLPYWKVSLPREQRTNRARWAHPIVCEAFRGPKPGPHYWTCHNDNNGLNNRVDNLRWDTPAGNHADKLIHGTHNGGDNHYTFWRPTNIHGIVRRF